VDNAGVATDAIPLGESVTGSMPTVPCEPSSRVIETNAHRVLGVRESAEEITRVVADASVTGPGGHSLARRESKRVTAGGVRIEVARRPAIDASSHGTMI
jgi:hypothetical protein